MSVIRLSLVRPQEGEGERVRKLLDELNGYVATQEGFLGGYTFEAADGSATVGRVSMWETAAAANRVAQLVHTLALRASIQRHAESDTVEGLYAVDSVVPAPIMKSLQPAA